MSASLSNVFSDVYISGNCTVKGTLSSLAGSITSQWTTSGTLIYYTTGNVGIGTNNPTGSGSAGTVLHVADSTANSPTVHVDASVGTGQARLHLRSGTGSTNRASRIDFFNNVLSSTVPQWTIISGYDQNGTNDMRYVNYAGAITMAWAQNGNIGIGTTNPGSLLTVSGGVGIGSGYNAFTAPTGGLIVQGNVGIGTSNPGVNALQVTGNVVTSGFTSNATNTVFNFDTLTVPFVNATQVGIGNTAPTALLDMRGGSISLGSYDSSSGSRYVGFYNVNDANGPLVGMEIENTTLTGNYSQKLHFRTHWFGTNNGRRMTISEAGNVGIGTTSPMAPLHIYQTATGTAITSLLIGDTPGYANNKTPLSIMLSTLASGEAMSINMGRTASTSSTFLGYVYNGGGAADYFWIAGYGYAVGSGLNVRNDGKVGIGVTTPQTALWVPATSTTTGIGIYNADVAMILGNTAGSTNSNTGSIQVRAGGSSTGIGTGTYVLALNPEGGSVAIGANTGTAIPSQFYVRSSTATGAVSVPTGTVMTIDKSDGGILSFRQSSDNGTYSGLSFLDNNIGGFVLFRNYTGASSQYGDALHISGYNGVFIYGQTTSSVDPSQQTIIMACTYKQNGTSGVTNTASVGIGTTNPTRPFHLYGSMRLDMNAASYSTQSATQTWTGGTWYQLVAPGALTNLAQASTIPTTYLISMTWTTAANNPYNMYCSFLYNCGYCNDANANQLSGAPVPTSYHATNNAGDFQVSIRGNAAGNNYTGFDFKVNATTTSGYWIVKAMIISYY